MTDSATLVLIRHGQSAWNAENRFTGWQDPDLTAKGIDQARQAAALLHKRGVHPTCAFVSGLKRAQSTLAEIVSALDCSDVPTTCDSALNERNYGALTGLNKDDARAQFGAETVRLWRRSWREAPPEGESLRDTAARVLPYYERMVRPCLTVGAVVLVVAHGNSLRALVMQLSKLDEKAIEAVTLPTGAPMIYRLATDGTVLEAPTSFTREA